MADGGGDQVQAALVGAGDGVAQADGVAGGEAGRDADDALFPAFSELRTIINVRCSGRFPGACWIAVSSR